MLTARRSLVPGARASRHAAFTFSLALLVLTAGCGGAGERPFFPDAFGQEPLVRTVDMKHGFSLLLVDEDVGRAETSFSVDFKAPEPLDWMLWDGGYQDGVQPPAVTINGSPANMSAGSASGKDASLSLSITVRKVAGRETRSSHQARFEVFSNGALESQSITKVDLEVKGPPGARWSLTQHAGRYPAPAE